VTETDGSFVLNTGLDEVTTVERQADRCVVR